MSMRKCEAVMCPGFGVEEATKETYDIVTRRWFAVCALCRLVLERLVSPNLQPDRWRNLK